MFKAMFHFNDATIGKLYLISLTCNVPQLQANNSVVVPVKHLEGKVHPNCGPVVLAEELMDIALDDGCLSCAKFSYH